jgi:hypothetical protein
LDVALGYTVVMMGPDASKESLLIELEEVFGKRFRREVGSVVQQVLLRNYAGVSTHQLEGLLGLESLGGTESGLQFDMDVARGGIDENTAALVHLALLGLPLAGEQSASCGADEVIDRDPLAGEELILSKGVHTVANHSASGSRSGSLLLLGELASGAHGRIDETRASRVEPSRALRGRQSPGSHQKLDPTEGEMPQTEVPARQLLLCLC